MLIEMNSAGLSMIEADSLDQVKERNFYDLVAREYRDEFRALTERVARGEKGWLEFEARSLKGRRLWLETHAVPFFDDTSRRTLVLEVTRDITERKAAEEKIRTTQESLLKAQEIAKLGSWDWDILGNTLSWSDETYRIFALEPQEFPVTYEAFIDTVHPEDRDKVNQAVSEALYYGKPYSIDHRVVLPDGTERIVHEQAEITYDEGSQAVMMSGTVQDITDRETAAQNMADSLKEKEVLLKEVHHRVKNNMAIISSLLSMQSTYVDDPKSLDMLRESQNRIRSMALVHEKLYHEDDLGRIDVPDYVSSLVYSIRASMGGASAVETRLDVEKLDLGMDTLIPCGLIINELISNSFKHASIDNGGIVVDLSMKRLGDGMLHLSVSDNGNGPGEGFDFSKPSGLGLKLVSALASQLEGSLEFDGRSGTVVRLTFPE